MSDMPSAAVFAAPSPFPHTVPKDCAMPRERGAREQALRRQMRRRAAVDAVMILLATAGASLLATDSHDKLLSGLAVLSVGILLFVIRRSGDVSRLAEAGRWREEALVGRGLSLAQWHAGVPLPEWERRTAGELIPAGNAPDLRTGEPVQGQRGAQSGREVLPLGAGATGAGMPKISDSRDGAR